MPEPRPPIPRPAAPSRVPARPQPNSPRPVDTAAKAPVQTDPPATRPARPQIPQTNTRPPSPRPAPSQQQAQISASSDNSESSSLQARRQQLAQQYRQFQWRSWRSWVRWSLLWARRLAQYAWTWWSNTLFRLSGWMRWAFALLSLLVALGFMGVLMDGIRGVFVEPPAVQLETQLPPQLQERLEIAASRLAAASIISVQVSQPKLQVNWYSENQSLVIQTAGGTVDGIDRNGQRWRRTAAGCWNARERTTRPTWKSAILPFAVAKPAFDDIGNNRIAFSAPALGTYGAGNGTLQLQDQTLTAFDYRTPNDPKITFAVTYPTQTAAPTFQACAAAAG